MEHAHAIAGIFQTPPRVCQALNNVFIERVHLLGPVDADDGDAVGRFIGDHVAQGCFSSDLLLITPGFGVFSADSALLGEGIINRFRR